MSLIPQNTREAKTKIRGTHFAGTEPVLLPVSSI